MRVDSMKYIRPKTTTVRDAIQYTLVRGVAQKKPEVILSLTKEGSDLKIVDRYVLLDFFRALRPEEDFNYYDMMYTIYPTDFSDTYYPNESFSFIEFVKYWVDTSTVKEIPILVKDGVIESILFLKSKSKYIEQNMILIKNILDDINACDTGGLGSYFGWETDVVTVRRHYSHKYRYSKVPCLVFSCGHNMRVEVISMSNSTYIAGRYKVGEGWVQPMPYTHIRKWTHLMSIDELFDALTPYVDALKDIEEGEIPKRNKFGNRASKLNFRDRNKLEYEDFVYSF